MSTRVMPDEEDDGVITKKFMKKLMKSDFKQYYSTPHLNDILYLHYKSFKKIDNLQQYTGLKVLYLQGNCIKKIQNLDQLTNLRSLYLQENMISIIEGLDQLTQISNLNLSDNMVQKIEGISKLQRLQNLMLKNNRIGMDGLPDLNGLLECPSISCLDIQSNKIETEELVDHVLMKMPHIAVVYLQNNSFNKKISHYRKTLITKIPTLKYIDDKPIFDDQKRFAQAWMRGGLTEQRKERQIYKKEQEEAQLKQHRQFREMMDRYRQQGERQRQARQRQTQSQTDSHNQTNSKDESIETYKTPEQVSEKTPENQSEESQSKKNQESVKQQQSDKDSEMVVSQRQPSEKQLSEKAIQVQKDAYLDQLD